MSSRVVSDFLRIKHIACVFLIYFHNKMYHTYLLKYLLYLREECLRLTIKNALLMPHPNKVTANSIHPITKPASPVLVDIVVYNSGVAVGIDLLQIIQC